MLPFPWFSLGYLYTHIYIYAYILGWNRLNCFTPFIRIYRSDVKITKNKVSRWSPWCSFPGLAKMGTSQWMVGKLAKGPGIPEGLGVDDEGIWRARRWVVLQGILVLRSDSRKPHLWEPIRVGLFPPRFYCIFLTKRRGSSFKCSQTKTMTVSQLLKRPKLFIQDVFQRTSGHVTGNIKLPVCGGSNNANVW